MYLQNNTEGYLKFLQFDYKGGLIEFVFNNSNDSSLFLNNVDIDPFKRNAYVLSTLCGFNGNMTTNFLSCFDTDITNDILNAPTGERLRYWNKNDYKGFIFNPIDQMIEAYERLTVRDNATIIFYNPMFDNETTELFFGESRQISLTFNIIDEKLNATLHSMSAKLNDVFGKLYAQFTAIQRFLALWLGLGVGTFIHILNTLEVPSVDNKDILSLNENQIHFESEPIDISTSLEEFEYFTLVVTERIIPYLIDNNFIVSDRVQSLYETIMSVPDNYIKNILLSLLVKRLNDLGEDTLMFTALENIEGTLFIECMHYLYKEYKSNSEFKKLYKNMDDKVIRYIEHKKQRVY